MAATGHEQARMTLAVASHPSTKSHHNNGHTKSAEAWHMARYGCVSLVALWPFLIKRESKANVAQVQYVAMCKTLWSDGHQARQKYQQQPHLLLFPSKCVDAVQKWGNRY